MRQDKRVLAVCRVSSTRQDLEAQKSDLKSFLTASGYADDKIYYIERKTSATRLRNAEYDSFLQQIKESCIENDINVVAVWHLNRLGRREMPLIDIRDWLVEHNIDLVCKDPGFNLLDESGKLSNAGRMMFNMYMSVIAGDNIERREKFARGKHFAQQSGKYIGGGIQYGYMLKDKSTEFVINADEAMVVQRIFAMYESRQYSCQKIADELAQLNIKRRTVNWNATEVHRILKNEALCGGVTGKSKNVYPAIISRQQFDRVQQILKEKQTVVGRESKNTFFANQLIRCTKCGRKYIADTKQYSCIGRKNWKHFHTMTEPCTAPTVNAKILDHTMWRISEWLEAQSISRREETDIEDAQKAIAELNIRRESLFKQMKAVDARAEKLESDFYSKAIMPENRFRKLYDENRAERLKLESEKSVIDNEIKIKKNKIKQSKVPMIEQVNHSANMLNELDWSGKDRELCRNIIRRHIAEVNVGKDDDVNFPGGTHITLKMYGGKVFNFWYKLKNVAKEIYPCGWFYCGGEPVQFIYSDPIKKEFRFAAPLMWSVLSGDVK